MHVLRSILLATDLWPLNSEPESAAVRLATEFDSQTSLLHVLEPMPHWPVTLDQEQQQAAGLLQQVAERLASQHIKIAGTHVVVGSAADMIVQRAREIDVDLVIVGAGEACSSGLCSVGPVAEFVVEHASQPVLVVRPSDPQLGFRKILCPVDQSRVAAHGLRNALRLAQVFGGEMVVLTVIPEVGWLTAATETKQLVDAKIEYELKSCEEFETFLETIPTNGVKVSREVRRGVPHREVAAAVQDHQIDLIVMGATGRTGLVRVLLGSTTRQLLRHLPCSMLIVKQEDLIEELTERDLDAIDLLMAEGQELLAADCHRQAIEKFRHVLDRNPFHIAAVEGLAEANAKLGQREKAHLYRRRAQRLRSHASFSLIGSAEGHGHLEQ
ncbi:MAG: universal stress protein [Planctomycetes bacterium]|nr:universal stress protein [Planctomycetota bacterium]